MNQELRYNYFSMKFNWQDLPKPFFALAPMEGGTDTVFRQVVNLCGRPDVAFTEFTNCEGLLSKGREEVGKRLIYSQKEKPLIAQIWGIRPQSFFEVSKLLVEMGFDGIDINMGCPERNVVANGCCAGLIENPDLAKEIIKATREGAADLPVSVKTRIGLKDIQTEKWIGFLLNQNLDALTIHFRTQKEMSLVPAHWEEAENVVKLRDEISKKTVLIGNGDVESKAQGEELAQKYALDGIMIGRGVFHNPYVFNESVSYGSQTKEERTALLQRHLDLFEQTWKEVHPISERGYGKSYPPLKRFFKIYISGFEGAAELREKLMLTENIEEAKTILSKS
ncbi:MAG: tRNA-dihydrouridine synthase [Candidatus Levybacteria bacterium]|nr:tRNA-dihydrouridine synthase [Candidatus Levybacteria bacterium]